MVLIDELDLHLHPRWQRRVVDDLRETFPKVQFITTTHSPFIVQALKAGELLNLDGRPELPGASVEDIAKLIGAFTGTAADAFTSDWKLRARDQL